jgi:hypothetical protein
LHDVGEAEYELLPQASGARIPREEYSQRHPDQHSKENRDADEPEMLEGKSQNLVAIPAKKLEEAHEC